MTTTKSGSNRARKDLESFRKIKSFGREERPPRTFSRDNNDSVLRFIKQFTISYIQSRLKLICALVEVGIERQIALSRETPNSRNHTSCERTV